MCPAEAEEGLDVANKLVDVALALDLVDDVLVVVVAKATRKLFVVHPRFVLPLSPAAGDCLRVAQFELPLLLCPRDAALGVAICQELQQKLPKLNLTAAS